MPCQDRPADVYPKDLSSCQALACGTPDPCRPHSLSVSLPMWSGSLGARSMNVTSSPSPALPGGGGRCALTLSPDAGTLYPEPRGTQSTALAHQPPSLHVLSRDGPFLLLTASIRLGCFANSRVICLTCSQRVLCVPVTFPHQVLDFVTAL